MSQQSREVAAFPPSALPPRGLRSHCLMLFASFTEKTPPPLKAKSPRPPAPRPQPLLPPAVLLALATLRTRTTLAGQRLAATRAGPPWLPQRQPRKWNTWVRRREGTLSTSRPTLFLQQIPADFSGCTSLPFPCLLPSSSIPRSQHYTETVHTTGLPPACSQAGVRNRGR